MANIQLSFVQMVLALLPALVPFFFIQLYGLRLMKKATAAFIGMLLKYAVVCLLLVGTAMAAAVWADVLASLLFIIMSAIVVTRRAKLAMGVHLMPVLVGTAVSVALFSLYLLFIVMGSAAVDVSTRLLPLVALLCGGIMEINARALTFYNMGLQHHAHLYHYLLANGATPSDALFYFRKRAMERTALHGVSRMSLSVIASTPWVLWTLLLCQQSWVTAVVLQIALMVAAIAAALVSMSVSLYMAGRYMPDGYTLLHEDAAAEADDTEADDADEQEEGTTETLIDNENNN
ncbi:MAG: ABC transporter permease [Prevotella sp.]|nr:ABC transporter permease [Prevotella sp.]MEE0336412.1 ABC transporter permease [Prevotella sp.]